MVEELIRGIKNWPDDDKRIVALGLVQTLDTKALLEVFAAAHQRIHDEADQRRKQSRSVASGRAK